MKGDGVHLTLESTEPSLRQLLDAAGVHLLRPSLPQVWAVFKRFALLAVKGCPEEELLCEWGVYDFTGRNRFHFAFVRQFSLQEQGEYVGMEQLHCLLLYEPVAELRPLSGNLWSMDYPNVAAFFPEVEAHQVFQLLTAHFAPLELAIFQEAV